MSGPDALRRLRAAGWQLLRQQGKHTVLVRDGQSTTISLGSRISPRAEQGIQRLLAERGTRRELRGER